MNRSARQITTLVVSFAALGLSSACDPQSNDGHNVRAQDAPADAVVYAANNRADIALTGPIGWATIPLARSNGNGDFTVSNANVGDFGAWSSSSQNNKVSGDFDGDGLADIALTGTMGWGSIPVAFSNGNGEFRVSNKPVPNFPVWSATGATKLAGDFNGDGRTDIALTGTFGWGSIPVAFSNGDGAFTVTNNPISNFATWSATGAAKLVGDFNGNGRADIALTGTLGWGSIPVAFSNADGSFAVTNQAVSNFAAWSATGATKLVGDFNGDGRTDIALTGTLGWGSIPVAFSNGDGTFGVTNKPVADFAAWSATGATKLAGDFNGDGRTDIALTGTLGWGSIPVAFSNGDGSFTVTNQAVSDFPTWAATGATKLAGDFNGDGRTDIALTGTLGWGSIPVAFSNGDGTFVVTNSAVSNFPVWAATAGAQKIVGNFG